MWNQELILVYVFDLSINSSDFEFLDDLITLFRAYPWSYKNSLSEKLFDLMSKTYTGKDLIRNCTKHSGNFEMIGVRTSRQSTCNMLMKSTEVDQH